MALGNEANLTETITGRGHQLPKPELESQQKNICQGHWRMHKTIIYQIGFADLFRSVKEKVRIVQVEMKPVQRTLFFLGSPEPVSHIRGIFPQNLSKSGQRRARFFVQHQSIFFPHNHSTRLLYRHMCFWVISIGTLQNRIFNLI